MYFLLMSDSPAMPDALSAVAVDERNAPRRDVGSYRNMLQLVKGTYRTHAALTALEVSSPAVGLATG